MESDRLPTVPPILYKLAQIFGTEVRHRILAIPEKFGSGQCTGFVFNEHLRILILNYELKENIAVENPEADPSADRILFKFQNIFPRNDPMNPPKKLKTTPSVLIATGRISADAIIPIHSNFGTINIEVDSSYLKNQFDLSEKSQVLKSLLQNSQPLLFDQIVYPSLQKIIDEILIGSVDDPFKLFFFRVKTEELICRLLIELEKRGETYLYPLNSHDVKAAYQVKERILTHLETPPVISELAVQANMSPTKLKRLFKQIFGNSIFSYYQGFRMNEAARLLREKKLSVSEVGSQLGFTNLSHFSKVFNDHIGMKPKQYSRSITEAIGQTGK